MASFQVTAPESFNFTRPEEWPKWIRRFERYRLACGLNGKSEEMQVNALIYYMGDQADDILVSFGLSAEDKKKYNTVRQKFEGHFVLRRNTSTKEPNSIRGNKTLGKLPMTSLRRCMVS